MPGTTTDTMRGAAAPTRWLARLERGAAGPGTPLAAGRNGRLVLLAPDGSAPATAVRGATGVVLWGDLDNAAELAARHGLPPATDAAAIVMAVFQRHGKGLPGQLKGRHVVIVYDAEEDLFLAARDRVGMVPLYRRTVDGATEYVIDVDAFALSSDRRPEVNVATAAAYLGLVRSRLEETFLEGVERVPPGHVLTVEGGAESVTRHWLPPPVGAGADWVTADELPLFGHLLDAAVAKPLERGRGGIFLSGGLDSVSVAAAAVEHSRRHQRDLPVALSLLFPQAVSEEAVQRGVARSLGLELIALGFDDVLGEKGLILAGLELSAGLAAPLQNVWTPAYDTLTQVGRQHGIANVLTGGGGDEWLTVTPLIAADYIARGDVRGLFSYLFAMSRSHNLPQRQLWRNVLWTNGTRPLLSAAASRARARLLPGRTAARRRREVDARVAGLPAWFAPDPHVRASVVARLEERLSAPTAPTPLGPGGRYFREMSVTLDHPLFALDIEEIFADGLRNGAPHWDIYWDADLIEFLYRVPPSLLNRGGRSKAMVRADIARRLPDFGFETQRKLVSRDFFTERFFAELPRARRQLGDLEALARLGLIDLMSVRAHIDEAQSVTSAAHVDVIWRLMSLEAWARSRA